MRTLYRLSGALLLCGAATPLLAGVSPEEAAKLGDELTPVGANPAPNEDGSIPAWQGESLFTEAQKNYDPEDLEKLRKEALAWQDAHPDLDPVENRADLDKLIEDSPRVGDLIRQIGREKTEPLFTITADNYQEYADKLTEGHKALFELYPDTYEMTVYPSVRGAYYPDEILAATRKNATRAELEGTDGVSGAKLGFPYPIPENGAQVIWNHKLKYRGSAVKRYNDQVIVEANGEYEITKLIEDVSFEYANQNKPAEERDDDVLAYYLQETTYPRRVAGQFTLVHEIFGKDTSGRNAWIYNPGLGRVNRAPDVGYDNPSIGSDGMQFNDQVDMFNGSLNRYNWKLVGKKEMYIPYNSYMMNNPLAQYEEIAGKGHINPALPRYELHRVWVVEATLREGTRHQFAKRVFYLDEDSWSIVAVDNYDNRGKLWRFQEGHLVTFPFIPTTTASPEAIYDLQSGRYMLTALTNEGEISDFRITYDEGYFTPSRLSRRAR